MVFRKGKCKIMLTKVSKKIRQDAVKFTRFLSFTNFQYQHDLLTKSASLYLHWPFCKHICPYCNFNKYKSENVDEKRMEQCLSSEFNNMTLKNGIEKINTIYFGGGTPSLCKPSTIESLIKNIAENCQIDNDAEISFECNPSSGELEKLRSFKLAGVNRVSIGVQALNDVALSRLGRDHSTSDAISYIEEANRIFQGNVSIDLMFGRPGQSVKDWIEELNLAKELNGNHISLYQLTMERSTPMEKQHRKGEIKLPKTDEVGDMYHAAVQIFEDFGLHRYEVANFAREGYESKHNISYWVGNQYIGIGPGAHGRLHVMKSDVLKRYAHVQTPLPENWMKQVELEGDGVKKITELSLIETLEELILQGMRWKNGVNQTVFGAFSSGLLLTELIKYGTVENLQSDEFIQIDSKGIRATSKGMALLDSIIPELCASLNQMINLG